MDEILPFLVLEKYQIILDAHQKEFFNMYSQLYRGLYLQFCLHQGYRLSELVQYSQPFLINLANLKREFYDLLTEVIQRYPSVASKTKNYNSPIQSIWFSCLFNELESVFFNNGLLSHTVKTGKKQYCNHAVKSINKRIESTELGILPTFGYNEKLPEITMNERYICGMIEQLACKDDDILRAYKKYQKSKKRYFTHSRDNKDMQIINLSQENKILVGRVGKNSL